MKLKILAPMLFFATLFFSCSDNSNDLDPNCSLENAMMLKVGNYWIYNTTQIDEKGNISKGVDSSFVNGIKTVAGQQAFQMISHNKLSTENYTRIDTTYYIVDKNRVLNFFSQYYDKKWTVIADCSKKTWHVIDTIVNHSIGMVRNLQDNNLDSVIVKSHIQTSAFTTENQQISVGNTMIATSNYEIKSTGLQTIIHPQGFTFASGNKEHSFETIIQYSLAENIGIVKYETDIHPALHKTLIRYSVK